MLSEPFGDRNKNKRSYINGCERRKSMRVNYEKVTECSNAGRKDDANINKNKYVLKNVFGTVLAEQVACMMLFCASYAVKLTKLAIFEQHLYCVAFPQAFSFNSGCTGQ